jgi:hypothetical protein
MVEGGGGAGLAQQARPGGVVAEVAGGENLNGDVAVKLLIVGAIDLAHPTRADALDDSIMAQLLANHRKAHLRAF